MGFIPDTAINDYIFPVVAEEHGFRGAGLFISALALLLLQAVLVAFAARDLLGRLIVTGIVAMFFMHIFWNIGMCLALVPIAGIPIPLVSYGGTFMVVTLFLMGMVQSVWVHRNIQPVKKKEAEPEAMWKREAPRDPAYA
jgi:rod shape determining protein RodA